MKDLYLSKAVEKMIKEHLALRKKAGRCDYYNEDNKDCQEDKCYECWIRNEYKSFLKENGADQ